LHYLVILALVFCWCSLLLIAFLSSSFRFGN
jgi:hypothetical protein